MLNGKRCIFIFATSISLSWPLFAVTLSMPCRIADRTMIVYTVACSSAWLVFSVAEHTCDPSQCNPSSLDSLRYLPPYTILHHYAQRILRKQSHLSRTGQNLYKFWWFSKGIKSMLANSISVWHQSHCLGSWFDYINKLFCGKDFLLKGYCKFS